MTYQNRRPNGSLRLVLAVALAAVVSPPSSTASGSGPASVLTQHNDNGRSGANLTETTLTTANVNVNQFGKLFARPVDGHIYAQPLYVPGLAIPGQGTHNVVFVATMHDSIYAFDADDPAASTPLWQVSLGTSAPITYTIPNSTTVGHDFGPPNYRDIAIEVGATSTPVIDTATNTLYAVAFTKEPNPPTCPCNYTHRLHALNLTTGAEKFGGPVVISGTVPGNGWDSSGGIITFQSKRQLQRAGLLLSNGIIYIAFGAYADQPPYHGWVFGYDAATLQPAVVYNTTPSSNYGGVWQAGQGPAADASGNLYVISGNGHFSNTVGDYSDSFIKLNPSTAISGVLQVVDSFTPYNQALMDANDLDLGSAGPLLIPGTQLLLGGGKTGTLYLLNSTDMGGYQQGPGGADRVVQSFQATNTISNTGHIHGSPVFWNSPSGPLFYVWGEGEALKQYSLTIHSPVSATIQTTPVATGTTTLSANFMPGGFLAVSANGSTAGTGIVWTSNAVANAQFVTVDGFLRAFDAANVGNELWDSTQYPARDSIGKFAKFNPPTVANGRVYAASFSKQLLVYGVMGAPWIIAQPMSQTIVTGESAPLAAAVSGQSPLTYQWYRGTSGDTSNPIASSNSPTYTTPALTISTNYWVVITNTLGVISSTTAAITVTPGPGITAQPLSLSINPGHAAPLNVTALGISPLSYQWYQGSSGDTSHLLPGAIGPNFTTPVLSATTHYWVSVTNPAGTISSTTAVMTVVPPLPNPWEDADIGYVGYPGSGTLTSGTFTLTASGGDIWGTADGFNFAYQPMSGDGAIIAHVTSLGGTDAWAKAGVMIRESLDPSARNALMALSADNGLTFQRRTSSAGTSINTSGAFLVAPYWVKLVRSGNTFSGYQSSDGTTWALVGSNSLPMTTTVYLGLAVTAHNNDQVTTAAFDHVSTQGTNVSPLIIAQPASQEIVAGQNITLTVGVIGTPPLSYQWYRGGSGDTSQPVGGNLASYVTPPLTTTTSYWVSVGNAFSTTNSATAVITVKYPPSITTQPLSQVIIAGQSVTVSVVATGTLPLSFQWYQGGSGDISQPVGGDLPSYVTPPLKTTTTYWVRVSNTFGSADSSAGIIAILHQVYLPVIMN